MKVPKLMATIALIAAFTSCGKSTDSTSAEGFSAIEEEIKDKFGDNAYYTDLTITHNQSIGNIIGVTVTEAPESLKMGQWNLTQGNWRQNSDISLEVPQGSKAADFMFQLNDRINLSKLGDLVERSSKQLTAEKNLENPSLHMATIKFPKNGDVSKTEYLVMLQPEHGGTTFTFRYALNGDFIEMDY